MKTYKYGPHYNSMVLEWIFRSLFFLCLVYIVGSCREKPSHYQLRDTVPLEQFTFIDTLKEMAIRHYMIHPDTSEYLLGQAIHACDSFDLPKKKFQILLEKAEFYQYRKPNFLKCLKNLSEAVAIFIVHPGPYAEDPYIYINIGNFFFKSHHFNNSRSFYNLAFIIANKITHQHAAAISLQNIGLSFEQEGLNDSARFYYLKAWHTANDVGYLTMAQNFYYLAGQYLKMNKLDSVTITVDSGFRMINRFKLQSASALGTVYPKLLVNCEEIESNLHYISYQFFQQTKNRNSALFHFEEALKHARIFQSNSALHNLLLVKVFDSTVRETDIMDEILADSALHYAKQINDPFELQQTAEKLTDHFYTTGNRPAFEKYSVLYEFLTDSLNRLQGSRELFESEILISSTAAEQAIQRLNFEKGENTRSLKYHRMAIFFIILIASIISLSLFFFIRQYKKLQNAYSNLADRIKESLLSDETQKLQNNLSVNELFADIIFELEHLMHEKKIYLNPDLTQNELASILKTNKTYLSNILRQQLGMTFNEYMNKFRIEEACRIILDPAQYKLSFDHILEKSGFNSKSTFYAAFKKFTGMSPAAFIKTIQRSAKTAE